MTAEQMHERFFTALRAAVEQPDPAFSAELVAEHRGLLDRADGLGPAGRRLVMRLMCSRAREPLTVAVPTVEAVLRESGAPAAQHLSDRSA